MLYVTGDLHGDLSRFKDPKIKRLRAGDILIICGDFGFLWDGGKKEQRVLKKLGRKKYTIAFLDGVHENHELLSQYEVSQWNGGKVHHICGNLYHLMRGQVFTFGQTTVFTLGGGEDAERNLDNPFLANCMPTVEDLLEANRCLEQVDYKVDYVITHECTGAVKHFLDMDSNEFNHLDAFFNDASRIIEFRRWYFGSRHIDKAIPPRYVGVFRSVLPLE